MPSIREVTGFGAIGRVVVSYPVSEQERTITKAEYDLIVTLGNDRRAAVIEFISRQYALSLHDAMKLVDTAYACDFDA